jgi:hypothetical protein
MAYNNKAFKETNINYINKDFGTLKNTLIEYAKSYFPTTYKDFNETSPGMMLIEMSAYVGDVLSFYIDQQYREMLLPLAEERRNVNNIARMLGYKIKPIIPAYVDLTFKQTVDDNGDGIAPKFEDATTIAASTQITSTTDSDIIFETLDIVDFTVSSSIEASYPPAVSDYSADGIASNWEIIRKVRAISGETKTITFNVGTPTKFLELKLSDTNVVNIISVLDTNGNKWHEVDYLAQDKVPIESSRTGEATYQDEENKPLDPAIAVPYTLEFIRTGKRFIVETNDDNTTSLIFGNGILRSGQSISSEYLQTEQVGITIPGTIAEDLTTSLDPTLGDEYSTLGETPMHTTLTVKYRVGGGINANVAVGDLANHSITGVTITVTNDEPARGGSNQESIDEIRHRAKANFATQNRCVTKQDYEARIMAMPAKFGNVAKAYVERTQMPFNASNIINDITRARNGLIPTGAYYVENMPISADVEFVENLNKLLRYIDTLGSINIGNISELAGITAWILSYDNNKNLVRIESTDPPHLLVRNLKNYLIPYRLLTDEVIINPGYIINFGVIFQIYAHKHANKQDVKLNCIQKIIDYFSIDKMQFRQPIYVSQLEYELMGVDGVRAVDYVCLTQNKNWKDPNTGIGQFSPGLWLTEWHPADEQWVENPAVGQAGYGYKFDFKGAEQSGVVLPSVTPSIFELKNPTINVKGKVL